MADKLLKSITFPDLADRYVIPTDAEDFTYEGENLKEVLDNKANTDGYYEGMTAGTADQLNSTIRENDKTPYVFRTSGGSVDIGDREYVNGIVGGTVAWNQLCNLYYTETVDGITKTLNNDGSITLNGTSTARGSVTIASISDTRGNLINNHVYYLKGCPNGGSKNTYYAGVAGLVNDVGNGGLYKHIYDFTSSQFRFDFATGTTFDNVTIYPQLIDLTQMFGSTIADYIYSLETANAGAGVAWFKKLFNKPYYEYNAGELKSVSGLVSHDMTGFNQWDEEWEVGGINESNGNNDTSNDIIRSKNYIAVVPNTSYYCSYGNANKVYECFFYDADKGYLSYAITNNGLVTTPANCVFMRFRCRSAYGTAYNHDICINISWDGSRDGEYEPYVKHSYPLDSSLTLRGIPKLDANNSLYYDGDVYEPDGTVTRKYGVLAMDTVPGDWVVSSTNVFELTLLPAKFQNDFACLTDSPYIQIPRNADTTNLDMVFKAVGEGTTSHLYFVNKSVTTISDFLATVSGKHLVYELATPTTETADPYNGVQIVDDFGTEEYVLNGFAVPVGHDTDYPVNLKAKLEMAPDSPSGDGDYIVRQTNGTNAYVPLVIEDALPTIPSTAGSYKLIVTVAEGSDPVLSWESEA